MWHISNQCVVPSLTLLPFPFLPRCSLSHTHTHTHTHTHLQHHTQLVELLSHRVPPGVDEAAYPKAAYLSALALGTESPTLISRSQAIELLGTMQGGYNVATLVTLLSDADTTMAKLAGEQLKHTLLVFDAFHDVEELHKAGNAVATEVLESWANAEWYTSKPEVADKITVTVFKGECLFW